jgi:hypothetical protein
MNINLTLVCDVGCAVVLCDWLTDLYYFDITAGAVEPSSALGEPCGAHVYAWLMAHFGDY